MIADNQNYKCPVCRNKMELYLYGLFDDRYGAPGRYSIYHCSKCGFGETYPRLKESEIGKFYAKYYPLSKTISATIRDSAKIPNRFYSWLCGTDNAAHYYISPKSKVLDIGSGSGRSLLEIEKLGGEAYGVEPDPSAQKIAKELKLHIHQGFITDNFFPGMKFDYITASQVIEHDPDPKTFMMAARGRLNKTGKVILSFPNIDALYRKICGRRWIHWHVPYHCNFFTVKSFSELAKNTGFRITRIRTITPNLWTILQIRMLMTKPKEGVASPVWSVKTQSSRARPTFTSLVKRKFITSIIMLLSILIVPINRIIDLFGQGDSFLVIMEKNYDR